MVSGKVAERAERARLAAEGGGGGVMLGGMGREYRARRGDQKDQATLDVVSSILFLRRLNAPLFVLLFLSGDVLDACDASSHKLVNEKALNQSYNKTLFWFELGTHE